jgi:quercetin dioxygenase-like cupin family protein|tara:strand:+ start:66 stop:332 length:267 start_codon:yes stop_codon:yes gene_type:complete
LVNPYKEFKDGDCIIRTFEPTVNESELVWHRDKKDRVVVPILGKGWKFQMDNDLPRDIKIGEEIFIPKNTFHRLHLGESVLKVKILEK